MHAPLFWLAWPFGYYATADLADTCGQDVADIASIPIDQYQQVIQPPTDAQHAALDELANAATKAAQDIKAACPAELALTAPGRLAAMQRRIEAMLAGVQTVQPPLEKFYGLLNDEQKAKVNMLGGDKPSTATPGGDKPPTATTPVAAMEPGTAQNCSPTQLGAMQLPNAEIDKTVRPTDEQKMILVGLQNATTQAAADLIKVTCVASNPLTPAAKLAAVGKRLETMLESIKAVRTALNGLYGSLSDEQKARFEAIGPQTASDDADDSDDDAESEPEEAPPPKRYYRQGVPSIGNILRHLPF